MPCMHALGQCSVKWFRAPQGRMTSSMRVIVVDERMRHALGDAYCDDWCISDHKSLPKCVYGGCPGDVTSFYLRCQGELLGLWDPQNRDLRRKLPGAMRGYPRPAAVKA